MYVTVCFSVKFIDERTDRLKMVEIFIAELEKFTFRTGDAITSFSISFL